VAKEKSRQSVELDDKARKWRKKKA